MAALRILPCAFVFFMVMGLIMFGVATPTEAAATGVFGALVRSGALSRLSWRMMVEAFTAAATVSALLLVIMCCAVMFSQLLDVHRRDPRLAELVANLEPAGRFDAVRDDGVAVHAVHVPRSARLDAGVHSDLPAAAEATMRSIRYGFGPCF